MNTEELISKILPEGDIDCITSAINHCTDSYDERAEIYFEILEMI